MKRTTLPIKPYDYNEKAFRNDYHNNSKAD